MTLRADNRERLVQQNQARQEGWARWSKPSRFLGFILIIVFVLTGVWFLFEEREEHVPVSSLALVEPDEEPYKVQVDDQQVLSVRHQDKLVYTRLHQGGELPQVEHLLPEPEAPMALTEYAPEIQVVIDEAVHEGEAQEQKASVEPVSSPQIEEKVIPTPEPESTPDPTPSPKPAPKQKSIDPIASLISGQTQSTPSQSYNVRVATMDTEEQAKQEWSRLQKKHKALLQGKNSVIEQVDLGQRGIKYTLEVGTFNSAAGADNVAKDLNGVKVRSSRAPS